MLDVIWFDLTDAQASILSSLITLLAAVFAVIFGSRLFQGKVTNLQDALNKSKEDMQKHIDSLKDAMKEIEQSTTVTLERVAEISGRSESNGSSGLQSNSTVAEEATDPASRFRIAWEEVRDDIEENASADRIDGRRRAKYGRIDRRNYYDLVFAMQSDGEIRSALPLADEWYKAINLRQSFRNGKKKPTLNDAIEMERIAALI